jgi:tetratricopeptide (TPR) repeat protein
MRCKHVALKPPDSHHLNAAIGWLELGDHIAANEELEKIAPELRVYPSVLKTRWSIYAKAKKWDVCIDLAVAIKNLAPEDSFGWTRHSYALHELKRTQEAYDNLAPVQDRFPKKWMVPYNLACYAAQLGKIKEAAQFLEKAMEIGDKDEIRIMAIDDSDLEPLWENLGKS